MDFRSSHPNTIQNAQRDVHRPMHSYVDCDENHFYADAHCNCTVSVGEFSFGIFVLLFSGLNCLKLHIPLSKSKENCTTKVFHNGLTANWKG